VLEIDDSGQDLVWSHPGRGSFTRRTSTRECSEDMIALGIILVIIGFIAKVAILWTVGIVLLVVGAVLMAMGSMGRLVGGRRHYY
jgi:hypothetical protein